MNNEQHAKRTSTTTATTTSTTTTTTITTATATTTTTQPQKRPLTNCSRYPIGPFQSVYDAWPRELLSLLVELLLTLLLLLLLQLVWLLLLLLLLLLLIANVDLWIISKLGLIRLATSHAEKTENASSHAKKGHALQSGHHSS